MNLNNIEVPKVDFITSGLLPRFHEFIMNYGLTFKLLCCTYCMSHGRSQENSHAFFLNLNTKHDSHCPGLVGLRHPPNNLPGKYGPVHYYVLVPT